MLPHFLERLVKQQAFWRLEIITPSYQSHNARSLSDSKFIESCLIWCLKKQKNQLYRATAHIIMSSQLAGNNQSMSNWIVLFVRLINLRFGAKRFFSTFIYIWIMNVTSGYRSNRDYKQLSEFKIDSFFIGKSWKNAIIEFIKGWNCKKSHKTHFG